MDKSFNIKYQFIKQSNFCFLKSWTYRIVFLSFILQYAIYLPAQEKKQRPTKTVIVDSSKIKTDSLANSVNLLEDLKNIQQSNPSSIDKITTDNTQKKQVKNAVKNIVEQELKESKSEYSQHKETRDQSRSFVKILTECEQANIVLKEGFNYKLARNQIKLFREWNETSTDGILKNKVKVQSTRDLTTTSILLNEILKKTETSLLGIKKFETELDGYQFRLDSLIKNSNVYQLPSDSAEMNSYLQKLLLMKSNLDPTTKSIKAALDSIQDLEIQFDILRLHLKSDIAATEKIRKNIYLGLHTDEIDQADKAEFSNNTFESTINHAMTKALLVFAFYYANHSNKFLIMLLAFIFVLTYLNLIRKRSFKLNFIDTINAQTKVLHYPVSSAVLITLSFFQFFLPEPPFVISSLFWVFSLIALSFFIKHFIDQKQFFFWLLFIVMFIVTSFINSILRYSNTERIIIYMLNISSMLAGVWVLYFIRRLKITDYSILIPLIVMLLFEALSLYFNLQGSYNQSKMFMVNGIMIFVLSYLLLWCIRLVTETLNISIYFQKRLNDETHDLPSGIFNRKMPFSLYAVMVLASMYLIYRTSFTYQSLSEPLMSYFTETRTIGQFSFTLESIFIFFLVLYISTLISKIVSFLSLGIESVTSKSKERKEPGSWLLLIKIGIISSGILLAFVAAGIPIDRLAIFLSAVGVGLVFGLQTLINNLVSGLFIAIEKPINVGDFVEIAGQAGKMKSIGIRSSIISTFDGADVIIPNGDLMNQHLTNWTKGNTRKRFEIKVGVAYGTDLNLVQDIIKKLITQDKRIMKNPEPLFFFTEFNNSSIDFTIKFWVYHYDDGKPALSDLIIAINNAFKEYGIEIPFPQQDIHIKNETEKIVSTNNINTAITPDSTKTEIKKPHRRAETFEGSDD